MISANPRDMLEQSNDCRIKMENGQAAPQFGQNYWTEANMNQIYADTYAPCPPCNYPLPPTPLYSPWMPSTVATCSSSCDSTTSSPPMSNNDHDHFTYFKEGGGKIGKQTKSRPYHPPTKQVLQHRRQQANSRERRRMSSINDAYELLRSVLPDAEPGKKLSKHETLQLAQEYINQLTRIRDEQAKEQQQLKQQ